MPITKTSPLTACNVQAYRQHTVHCAGHWTAYNTNRSNKGEERSRLSQLSVLFMYIGDWLTTCFGPKGPSSSNECIKTSKKSYWVMGGLYIDDTDLYNQSVYTEV